MLKITNYLKQIFNRKTIYYNGIIFKSLYINILFMIENHILKRKLNTSFFLNKMDFIIILINISLYKISISSVNKLMSFLGI